MRISDSQCDEAALTGLGSIACQLVMNSAYQELADRFGYALAFGKDPAEAIRMDVESCLSQSVAPGRLFASNQPSIRVGFFKQDDAPFFAVVECQLKLPSGSGGLAIDLIVTTVGTEKHITLEHIHAT